MALTTVLETLDGIDDAFKPHYTEKDGKFVLQIEGVDNHPDVTNLKNAYERQKADKAALITERDALKLQVEAMPSDFDLKVWAKAKDGKADEAALVSLRAELEAKITEAQEGRTQAEAKLAKFAGERDLSDALALAGITDPMLMKGATAMLSGSIKTGENGQAFVDTDMGPIGLVDHVKRWAAGDGKSFVTPPKGGDRSGSNGGGSQKRWADMTSSEKVALNKSDPEAYNRAKATG